MNLEIKNKGPNKERHVKLSLKPGFLIALGTLISTVIIAIIRH